MMVRGIRGATTVPFDTKRDVMEATGELLTDMVGANGVDPADIAYILFTCTPDIVSAFPAAAARGLGWSHVPVMDALEIDVQGALPLCIRVMMVVNTGLAQDAIRHRYLRGAAVLRPDLAGTAAVVPK